MSYIRAGVGGGRGRSRLFVLPAMAFLAISSGNWSAEAQSPVAAYAGTVQTTTPNRTYAAKPSSYFLYPNTFLLVPEDLQMHEGTVIIGVDSWQLMSRTPTSMSWRLVNAAAGKAAFDSMVVLPVLLGGFRTSYAMGMDSGATMTATLAPGGLLVTISGTVSEFYTTSFVSQLSFPGVVALPRYNTPLDFYTLQPCRLVDTRNAVGPRGGPALKPGEIRSFTLTGACALPSTMQAISANITVIGAVSFGYLTLFPGDQATPPVSSTIIFVPGQARANNAFLGLAWDGLGGLKVRNSSAGSVHLVIDVNGYFQ